MISAEKTTERFDVAIAGAGAAGLAAAITAAKSDADVLLIEKHEDIGGTIANALIHTIGGLYDSEGELLHDGVTQELLDRLLKADHRVHCRRMGRVWVLNVCPDIYRATVRAWLNEFKNVRLLTNHSVSNVYVSGSKLEGLEMRSGLSRSDCCAAVFVDATGNAELVRILDDSLVDIAIDRSASGWIWRIRAVSHDAIRFPNNVAIIKRLSELAEEGELPPIFQSVWIDTGFFDDEVFLKFTVNPAVSDVNTGNLDKTISNGLKRIPEFNSSLVTAVGRLGIRDCGRVRGVYQLSEQDVRQCRKFEDGVARCSWPIEYWDPKKGVSLQYLPARDYYEIPLRALQLSAYENLFVVGKCLSADRLAHASARIGGCCWAMGQAVANVACKTNS